MSNLKNKIYTIIKSHKNSDKFNLKSIITYLFFILMILTVLSTVRLNTLRVLITIVAIFPCYLFSKHCIGYFYSYKNNNSIKTSKILGRILVCMILSTYIYLSFYHKFIGGGKLAAIANLGYITIVAILIFIITTYLSNIKVKKLINTSLISPKKRLTIFLLASLFPLSVGTIMLLGFFPGSMNIDYFVIYENILTNTYMDAHPVLYTMLLRLLLFAYDSPAALSIFHILLSSFTYTYVAYRLNKIGLNIVISCLLVVVLTLIPANIFINSILWKDVIYTMFLLLFSIEILRMFIEDNYFKKVTNIVLLSIFGFFVLVARHNGQYVMILFGVITSIYYLSKKQWKKALKFTIIIGMIITSFYTVKALTIHLLGDNFVENRYTSSVIYSTPAQGILVLYIDDYDRLNQDQRSETEHFIDIEATKERNARIDEQGWAFDMWKFKNDGAPFLRLENVNTNKNRFFRLYLDLIKDFPNEVFDAYMKNTALAWSSLEYEYTYAMALQINEPYGETIVKIEQNIILEKVNIVMTSLAQIITRNDLTHLLFFRPAFMLILISLLLLMSKNKRNAIFLSLPILLNHFGYFLGCSAQDTRYMYGNYSLFVIMLCFVLLSNAIENKTSD